MVTLHMKENKADAPCLLTVEQHHTVLCQLLKVHAARWKEIGQHLGFLPGELDNIQAKPLLLQTAPESWLNDLLEKFLQGDFKGGFHKSGTTLDMLENALKKAGLGATGDQLWKDIQQLQGKPPDQQPKSPQNCMIHNQRKRIYCFNCDLLVCENCMKVNHSKHKNQHVSDAAVETKKEVLNRLIPLREAHASLDEAIERVQITRSEVEAQGVSIADKIEHSFQELHQILEQHKNQLLVEASKKVQDKVGHLSTQEKSFIKASAEITNLVDFVGVYTVDKTNEEFMLMHKKILSRIGKEVEQHYKRTVEFDPVEIADLKFEMSCAEKINHFCQTDAQLYHLPDPSKCTVDGPGLKNAEVSKQTHTSIKTVLHNGTPTKKPQKVTAELKSIVNRSVIRLEGVRKQENTYEIRFTPTARGRHQLVVNVNDQPIAGSPFPVYVKIPPAQLGKPVRVLTGLDRPYGVAMNSTSEILVTEHDNIAVFNRCGKKLHNIKPQTEFTDLTGIAVDEEDILYVTDCQRHSILKLTQDGKVLHAVGKKGKGLCEFNDPRGVAVIEDKVFVCDKDNHRIQVLTKERLEFIELISSNENLVHPTSITNERGNLYVSDYSSNFVKLLKKGGEFLFSFSEKNDKLLHLNGPHGVCARDQFVFVTEYWGCCVSVFTGEGQFVTSFGKKGDDLGEFNRPFGICVDCDGFVYVCDLGNQRVQVF